MPLQAGPDRVEGKAALLALADSMETTGIPVGAAARLSVIVSRRLPGWQAAHVYHLFSN